MGDLGAAPGMISVKMWMEVQDSKKTGLNELEDIPERGRGYYLRYPAKELLGPSTLIADPARKGPSRT
jgi:hypothetical protein